MLMQPRLEGMEHLGKRPYLRMPWKMSKNQIIFERSPLFGEHNDHVFRELLGMTRREMAELEGEGVIGKRPLAEDPTYLGATTVPCPILKELGRIAEWDENFHEILGLD